MSGQPKASFFEGWEAQATCSLQTESNPTRQFSPFMMNRLSLPFGALAISLWLPFTALQAEDPFAPAPMPREPKFDLELIEPTIPQLCNYLIDRASTPDNPINIVVTPEAENLRLPTLKLRRVTFKQVTDFVSQLGESRPTGQFSISNRGGIHYIWARKPQTKLVTSVLHLGDGAEAALGLIDETLAVTPREYQPSLKFHEPSQSLIVTANADDLRLISEVVSQIEKRQRGAEAAEVEAQLAHSQDELAAVQESQRQMMIEYETRLAARLDLEAQVAKSKAELAKARETTKLLEAELKIAHDNLAKLEAARRQR